MNSIQNTDQLVSTIHTLERTVKSQRKIVTITLFLSLFLFSNFMANLVGIDLFRPQVIRAKSFVLQDESGAIRSELSTRNDMTIFAMYDRNGIPRNALFSEPESNGLHVYDEKGIRRSVLGYKDNETSLIFINSGGLYQGGLIAKNEGEAVMQMGEDSTILLKDMMAGEIN